MDELRKKVATLEKQLRAVLHVCKAEMRPLTDEEQTKYDETRTNLEGLEKLVAEEERLAEKQVAEEKRQKEIAEQRAKELEKPSTPVEGPGAGTESREGAEGDLEIRAGSDRWLDRGFATLGEQLQAIHAASDSAVPADRHDRRLEHIHAEHRAISGLSETVPTDGGFLLQKDFVTSIKDRMHDQGQIMSRVRQTPISATSTGLKFNVINETSRADGSRAGGVRAYWRDEGAAFTASQTSLRQVELSLSELTALLYATGELIADAPALTARANRDFADELLFKTEDAIWEGDGVGKPIGVLAHAGTIDVTKEAGQAANTIVPENITKMYSRARNRQNGVWMINQDIEPQLWLMSLAVGTGGGPVFMPPGGLSTAPFATLMGRPVIAVEFASTLGTSGDIAFCDWDAYEFIDKGTPQFDSSIHVRFLFNEQTFRAIYRLDGQPLHNTKLTPFKGTTTTAHFITLATRS